MTPYDDRYDDRYDYDDDYDDYDDEDRSALPEFTLVPHERLMHYMREIFGLAYHKVFDFPDRHYRVLFSAGYFHIQEGATDPSKSQWSTLKKKMKRHNQRVFVFKEYGSQQDDGERYYYLEFGFYKHWDR